MYIEEVASKTPEKIITTRLNITEKVSDNDVLNILKPYNLKQAALEDGKKIIQALYQALIKTDANLIEVNPLILTKDNKVICLDAKINFDDNALFRHPEILEYRDLNEEDPMEIEASKHDLAYIKLDGEIGCMVNGAKQY